jgi:hypothetical protein
LKHRLDLYDFQNWQAWRMAAPLLLAVPPSVDVTPEATVPTPVVVVVVVLVSQDVVLDSAAAFRSKIDTTTLATRRDKALNNHSLS